MNPACFTDGLEGLTSRPRTSGGYVQTSGIFHQKGPSSIPIVPEIGVGLEVKMFTVKRVAHSRFGHEAHKGELIKLSRKAAEAILDQPMDSLTNIRMRLMQDGGELPGSVYAKVIDAVAGSGNYFSLRFTSVSPEIEKLFQAQSQSQDTRRAF